MICCIAFPNIVNCGIKFLCLVFSINGYTAIISAGININTTIRLIATPFASARPRSIPIPNLMNNNAKKPITVVRPLEEIDEVDLHNASTMAPFLSGLSLRHSSYL